MDQSFMRLRLDSTDAYYDLGSYQRLLSASNEKAKTWFNRGLIWSYGFNHEEASKCFEKAITCDPRCPMAYWGLAYALGPNYNRPWDDFDDDELHSAIERTHAAALQAKECAVNGSPVEKALVDALQFRYPLNAAEGDGSKDWQIRNREYAGAMRSVFHDFSDDLDVATLFIDALMNLTPWKMWDIKTGKPNPEAATDEIQAVFEHAFLLRDADKHPGLLHLYIHFMEMSPRPEDGLTMADCLRGLVPDSGHLQHMPTHLDVLCGDYRRAIASNSDAIEADSKYLDDAGPLNFYTCYRSHNLHFRIYAAMSSGQSKIAIGTADALEKCISEELLRVKSPPMADWLEGFLAMRVHVLVRFGRWHDILDLAFPRDQVLYCSTTAMIHFAKGVAFAATGKTEEAELQRTKLRESKRRVPTSRAVFNNTCIDLLGIAEAMLDAEIDYRRGEFDSAFAHLDDAVAREDGLPYDEPWGWMQPSRHAYGALLLQQGRVEEAAAKYKADLGFDETLPRALRHPNNVWALQGYHECLRRLGREAEAEIIAVPLRMALAVADVPIQTSCFCALTPR